MRLRLNKLLATRGVAARRKCDALIESGAVQVNGETITAPGAHVDPERDDVRVNGRRLPGAATHRYYVLNKPVGMISTLNDPQGRRSLRDVLPPGARVFPVGRLDADTSGLLLLTNDGDLAHHLMHPRYGVEKFYRVVIDGRPALKQIEKLQRGVVFEPGVRSAPARVRERDPVARGSVIEIAIAEGRYRQVRRMCEAVGLDVVALHRWGYGPLRLGELERGMWRELSEDEVRLLRAASARPKARPASVRRPRGRRRGEGIAREHPPGPEGGGADPFAIARGAGRERDVTAWPDEAPEESPRGAPRAARPRARRPRPVAVDPARRRAETSRGAMRRFGRVPEAAPPERPGARRRSGAAGPGAGRPGPVPRRGPAGRDSGPRGTRPRTDERRPGRDAGRSDARRDTRPGRDERRPARDAARRDTRPGRGERRPARDAVRRDTRPGRGERRPARDAVRPYTRPGRDERRSARDAVRRDTRPGRGERRPVRDAVRRDAWPARGERRPDRDTARRDVRPGRSEPRPARAGSRRDDGRGRRSDSVRSGGRPAAGRGRNARPGRPQREGRPQKRRRSG